MTAQAMPRPIPIFVLGEALARAGSADLAEDGTVFPQTFSDVQGRYQFVDIAMLGGVDYCGLYQLEGGAGPDVIAFGDRVREPAQTNPSEQAAGPDPADVPQDRPLITNASEINLGPEPPTSPPTVTNPSELQKTASPVLPDGPPTKTTPPEFLPSAPEQLKTASVPIEPAAPVEIEHEPVEVEPPAAPIVPTEPLRDVDSTVAALTERSGPALTVRGESLEPTPAKKQAQQAPAHHKKHGR